MGVLRRPTPPPRWALRHTDRADEGAGHAPLRRVARALLLVAAALGAVIALQASLAGAAGLDLLVNDTSDSLDSNPGDGECRTSAGTCTLRAAIQEANASPGPDAIRVPSGTYELAIPPLNQNDITTGDLDITDSLAIEGAGAGSTIVDGGTPTAGAPPRVHGLDRLFEVLADAGTVTFSGLTFRTATQPSTAARS
jgi:CSLREA domain-containing protein